MQFKKVITFKIYILFNLVLHLTTFKNYWLMMIFIYLFLHFSIWNNTFVIGYILKVELLLNNKVKFYSSW